MNMSRWYLTALSVSAGCHINDVMNKYEGLGVVNLVSAGCHINDVMNQMSKARGYMYCFSWMSYQ